ncbi:prepilin peptidase [Heyndrickxia sp. NPDC080065]|uniref:prepilin peptidase n=1 Tax=Heyndrickxia sp. NPDC080065 TaxID=3390568 RepID=UPI003CFBDB5F
MNNIWIIYFAVLGLLFGSFFNVVGLRVTEKKSILVPRSHCPHCKHELKWFELIPIFSFLLLRGKCRICEKKISLLYPVMEFITGFLFAFTFAKFGWSTDLLLAMLLISLIAIITVSDFVYMLIPDSILLFFGFILIVVRIFYPSDPWWDFIVGAVFGFVLLLLIAIISKGAMGGGDIKLFFVIGLVLGVKMTFLTFILSTLLGALFGVLMIIAGKYKKRKPIPFGPFIGVASIISFLYGNSIIYWYFNIFWY